jgi:translocation and assembly module TamA
MLACGLALGQEPKYRLTVEAPTREMRETLARGLQLARWQDDAQMTPELLRRLADEALAEAREALAAQGYYAALVEQSIDLGATPWAVTIRVAPGERSTVRAVEISFSGPAAGDPQAAKLLDEVRRDWLLRPGMPFTQEAWIEAKGQAVRKLASWRYAAARIASSRARVDTRSHSVALEITLESGPPYLFGEVEVRGGGRYPAELVENLSPLEPGATYDRELLELYTRRLLEAGYFAGAHVEGAAPVRASVIEGHSQRFEGGVSFNTDAGLHLELSHRNVDLLDSAWRGRAQLRLDELAQEARYDVDSPPRPGARWWNGFVAAKNSVIQEEENTEFSLGTAHNWAGRGAPTALLVSAHFEEQRIAGQAIDHRRAVFVGVRVGFRDTDAELLPRRGYFGQATLGGAPDALATRHFGRATARGTALYPLSRHDDLQLRGEAGFIGARSREGIPSTFLFRTGGDQTVRGYDFESLGVRQGAAVLGGRYLLWGSIEYTHWFAPSWGVALFADHGNAWDTGPFEPALGVGAGARFRTPIGPVRVDVAYGEEVKSWRLHFSVGFVF